MRNFRERNFQSTIIHGTIYLEQHFAEQPSSIFMPTCIKVGVVYIFYRSLVQVVMSEVTEWVHLDEA